MNIFYNYYFITYLSNCNVFHVTSCLPVQRGAVLQQTGEKHRPLLCSVSLDSKLKLHWPNEQVELIKSQLHSQLLIQSWR